MATSGQTLNDRINAARYALAGQGLARYVCKATTEEVLGPKKKHLDYLLACTHEANVSIPQLANLLIERTNHISWVVVFKALVTVHHLMSYGNERLIQYLASSNYLFELSTFLDKTSARDFSMSTFIRRYSRYINQKAVSYRLLAFDFCKIKRGNEGVLRQMPIDRLLKTLPILQNQLDALLEFDCTVADLNNGVIISCFMLLFRDLIGLFACHNDGIINLLNKYFTLNKKMCREAFDLYKKFLVRMDKVNDFLRVAEAVGLDKDDIPDLRRAPSSLIDALEQHLQNLESNKKILKSSNNSSTNNKSELSSVLGNLTPPNASTVRPSSPASANTTGGAGKSSGKVIEDSVTISSFKDDEVRRALEEEARVLSLYGSTGDSIGKSKGGDQKSTSIGNLKFSATTTGQEASKFSAHTTPKTIDDIFGDADVFASAVSHSNDNNSFVNSANGLIGSPFDKTSSTKTGHKQQHVLSKVDLESIKSAIQSATTTLEQASGKTAGAVPSGSGPKKASDDLFNLLDPVEPSSAVSGNPTQLINQTPSSMSPFATPSSPFDLPASSNGHTDKLKSESNGGSTTTLKPSNPFPDVSAAFQPMNFSNNPLPAMNSSTLKPSSTSLKVGVNNSGTAVCQVPNYTSLASLEGFGDVLQPTSALGRSLSGQNAASGKASFTSSTGLPGTGLFKGDLDSTLANLAQNLTFEGISKNKK